MDVSGRPHFADRLRQERLGRNWYQRDVAEHLGTTVVTVNRWERGIQQPSTHFRAKLCVLFGKSAQELSFFPEDQPLSAPLVREAPPLVEPLPISSSASFPNQRGVPYPRNPFFTDREAILHHLHEMLSQRHTMSLTQSLTVSGLGGRGARAAETLSPSCTSRLPALHLPSERIGTDLAHLNLDKMASEEGLRFLLHRAGWLDPTSSFDQPDP